MADMHFMYSKANGSAREVHHFYEETFPDRRNIYSIEPTA